MKKIKVKSKVPFVSKSFLISKLPSLVVVKFYNKHTKHIITSLFPDKLSASLYAKILPYEILDIFYFDYNALVAKFEFPIAINKLKKIQVNETPFL